MKMVGKKYEGVVMEEEEGRTRAREMRGRWRDRESETPLKNSKRKVRRRAFEPDERRFNSPSSTTRRTR